MGRPLRGKVVLGIDPGFRAGCKLAVIDTEGRVLETGEIFPHPPQRCWADALNSLKQLVSRWNIDVIALGNATASRETELLVNELFNTLENKDIRYSIVNEAGASVYSTSESARKEFPTMDPLHIGAVSIARRLIDPLSELCKIDPKAVGVGLYQHDISPKILEQKLDAVVEACVSSVGVNINGASVALLRHVSGLNLSRAKAIHNHCKNNGPFKSREELLDVKGFGKKSFEQAAGFLRVDTNQIQPLDDSPVHPESYAVAEDILCAAGIALKELNKREYWVKEISKKLCEIDLSILESIAAKHNVGIVAVQDIQRFLQFPGHLFDPRERKSEVVLRSRVFTMEELEPGDAVQGTIRNVVDFGAFIDIGVGVDALLHSSWFDVNTASMDNEGSKVAVAVGAVLNVFVESIDLKRRRISVSTLKREKGKHSGKVDSRSGAGIARNIARGRKRKRRSGGNGKNEGRKGSKRKKKSRKNYENKREKRR
eukprot:g3846.t1